MWICLHKFGLEFNNRTWYLWLQFPQSRNLAVIYYVTDQLCLLFTLKTSQTRAQSQPQHYRHYMLKCSVDMREAAELSDTSQGEGLIRSMVNIKYWLSSIIPVLVPVQPESGVCMFSSCLGWFSPGPLAFSHRHADIKLTGDSIFDHTSPYVWMVVGKLASYSGCTRLSPDVSWDWLQLPPQPSKD